MSKYAAKIQIGWLTDCFEGDTPSDVIRSVEKVQDFNCLLRMGRMEEGKKGQKELSKLEAFLEKYYEGSLRVEDISNLDVKLSIGTIKCLGIAESDEEIEKLKSVIVATE